MFMKAHVEAMTGGNNPQYGKFGKDHPAYGHETTEETREFRRQAAVKRVASQKTKGTDIEIILSELLDELGVNHISQYNFKNKFVVDEFLPDHNAIIEANGDYWHGNPTMFPNLNMLQKANMRRDERRWTYIHKCGYNVIFFWGNELLKHREYCRRRLVDLTKYILVPNPQDFSE